MGQGGSRRGNYGYLRIPYHGRPTATKSFWTRRTADWEVASVGAGSFHSPAVGVASAGLGPAAQGCRRQQPAGELEELTKNRGRRLPGTAHKIGQLEAKRPYRLRTARLPKSRRRPRRQGGFLVSEAAKEARLQEGNSQFWRGWMTGFRRTFAHLRKRVNTGAVGPLAAMRAGEVGLCHQE